MPVDAIAECVRLANVLADAINARMQKPKRIEVEKVYEILLNLCKKKYAGRKWVDHTSVPVMEMKGVDCVRRSGCPLVRDAVKEMLEIIVNEVSPRLSLSPMLTKTEILGKGRRPRRGRRAPLPPPRHHRRRGAAGALRHAPELEEGKQAPIQLLASTRCHS